MIVTSPSASSREGDTRNGAAHAVTSASAVLEVRLPVEQAAYADTVTAAYHAVWNTALEQRREYRRRGAWISYEKQARQLTEAKRDPSCA